MVSHSDTEINFSARCDFEVHDKVTIASGQIRSTESAGGLNLYQGITKRFDHTL